MASVAYTPFNAVKSVVLGATSQGKSVVTEAWTYNARMQPTSLTATASVSGSLTIGTAYCASPTQTGDCVGNNGNVVQATITPPGASSPFSQGFIYDSLNRLKTARETLATNSDWSQDYVYDAFGNRALLAGTGYYIPGGSWTPQVTTDSPSAAAALFTGNRWMATAVQYDGGVAGGTGNMTALPGYTFAYDAENRQTSATSAAGTTTYLYDGDGRRVQKVAGTAVTTYVYDAAGELAAEYGAEPEQPPCVTCYLTADDLGSTRMVTDATGTVKALDDFLPFGEEITAGAGGRASLYPGSDGIAQKFTGKERDTETGLDYFGARYMSSAQGRWTSPDLVNLTDDRIVNPSNTLNKYIYGGNNPLKYTDPDGRDITVLYEQGAPTGHVMMAAVNQQTGDSAILSVGPATQHDPNAANPLNWFSGVPGTTTFNLPTTADELRQNFAALTIQTSPEVAQQAIDAIRSGAGSGNWALLGNNCTSACAKVLHDIGLLPNGLYATPFPRPNTLWNTLRYKYQPNLSASQRLTCSRTLGRFSKSTMARITAVRGSG